MAELVDELYAQSQSAAPAHAVALIKVLDYRDLDAEAYRAQVRTILAALDQAAARRTAGLVATIAASRGAS